MSAAGADTFAQRWFAGTELYGDDLRGAELERWFADERDAYHALGAGEGEGRYGYHALNVFHGFSRLPAGERFGHVLGFGSNVGEELLPILPRIGRLTLLDSSPHYEVASLHGRPLQYRLAGPDGRIDLPDADVDLVSALSVLHHIANVSQVLHELARVLRPGGWLLLREPVHTMGDWRRPRRGLTPRERGLPRAWLLQQLGEAGFVVQRSAPCVFAPWVRLVQLVRGNTHASPLLTRVDAVLARLFEPNSTYHRTTWWRKFAPSAQFIVARRAGRGS